ncbi:MAG: hypothetical protein ACYCWE_07640 [Eubacteriales bacterium]
MSNIVSSALFGHNFEITRSTAFGGICAEMINNRKFKAIKNGLPSGFYHISQNGYTGLGQSQPQLYFEAGTEYSVRIRARSDADVCIKYRIKSNYFKVFYEADLQLPAGDFITLNDTFILYMTENKTAFEVFYPEGTNVEFSSFSLSRSDSFFGMKRQVLDLLKELHPSVLRYPGGCYAEFFNWKDGLSESDLRPCVPDGGMNFLLPDTYGFDAYEIGIDEFIEACRYVHAQPQITVRLSENQPQDAADWVEYCNSSPDTKWGAVRAERGYKEPHHVKTWYIGNELFAFGRGGLSADPVFTAETNNAFVTAMKAADPNIETVASTWAGTEWTDRLLGCGILCDMCSFHNYLNDFYGDVKSVSDIEKVLDAPHSFLLPLMEKTAGEYGGIPLNFDEWNYQWGKWGSAMTGVYTAGVLQMMIANAERIGLRQACYFTPLNESAIRIMPGRAVIHADGKAFRMYASHISNTVILSDTVAEKLDRLVTVSPDKKRFCVSYINRDIRNSAETVLPEIVLGKLIRAVLLTPKNGMITADDLDETLSYTIPPNLPSMSVCLLEFEDE